MISKLIHKIRNSSDKDKIIYRNVLGAFGVKGLSLLISLMTMPAYMRYFSDQAVLGIWFTVLSVLNWILNFDLGIGNGLRNQLTMSLTRKDYEKSRELISSAYWMVGGVVCVLFLLGNALLYFGNWNSFFNISLELVSQEDLRQVVQITFFGIMLQFFLRLISSIIYALQKSALNNLILLVTNVSQLIFALTAPCGTPVANLKMFAAAYVFSTNVPLMIATVVIFSGTLKNCIPRVRCFSWTTAKSVLSLGGIFFLCQILYMLIASTNEFFITQYTAPDNVVEYQIYFKLFSLGSTLFMLALTPIWSAVSRAVAEEDHDWLKRLNKNISRLSLLGVAAEFMIIPFLQWGINLWLGDNGIKVNYATAFCFALFGSSMLYQSGVSTIVNGMGKMRIQASCYGVGIIAKVLIIHFGVTLTGSWAVVPLSNALILIPYCIIQQSWLNRRLNSCD